MTKKFSTKNARRGGVSADIADWLEKTSPEEKLTLVYRLPMFADPDTIAAALGAAGVTSESVGERAIVGTVANKDLKQSLAVKGVLGVQMPEQLATKSHMIKDLNVDDNDFSEFSLNDRSLGRSGDGD